MAKALREGGLYYVNGSPVDAEGKAVSGAPKQPKDTEPSQQPGAVGAPTSEERIGLAIATGLATALAGKSPAVDDEDEDDGTLPTLTELPEHLAGIATADEVKALRKTDKRKGAKPIYEARLAEFDAQ